MVVIKLLKTYKDMHVLFFHHRPTLLITIRKMISSIHQKPHKFLSSQKLKPLLKQKLKCLRS